ncbi:MAG: class I SAM-dependent methyltransferase [Pseudomonadota bacterium]
MEGISNPATYEAWYHTRRGSWIAAHEFSLLQHLLNPSPQASLLDVGCGTGHFSRRFARLGLAVTGIDPDTEALNYAKRENGNIIYLPGSARNLPFTANSFDYTSAVTSLCFITEPAQALQEMWRVSRHGVVLGLLNRQSILHRMKQGQGSYRNARWDTVKGVQEWIAGLSPAPTTIRIRSAIFLPQGNLLARWTETLLPNQLPWGGFLVVHLGKSIRLG